MSASAHPGSTPYYFVPAPSRYPVLVALGMFFVILGAGQWINGHGWGAYSLLLGLVIWLAMLYQWFRTAIAEDKSGLYSDRVDVSFRWSMSWFIFSEVMFFAAFFGALYWARVHSVPMLGNLDHQILWPDFKAVWPTVLAGSTASPAGTVEPFVDHGPVAAADDQHRAAADLGRDADHRAPCADRQPARQDASCGCGSPWCWAPPSSACRPTNTSTPTAT